MALVVSLNKYFKYFLLQNNSGEFMMLLNEAALPAVSAWHHPQWTGASRFWSNSQFISFPLVWHGDIFSTHATIQPRERWRVSEGHMPVLLWRALVGDDPDFHSAQVIPQLCCCATAVNENHVIGSFSFCVTSFTSSQDSSLKQMYNSKNVWLTLA